MVVMDVCTLDDDHPLFIHTVVARFDRSSEPFAPLDDVLTLRECGCPKTVRAFLCPFLGRRELFLHDPAGCLVIFAEEPDAKALLNF
jgi:hypothetical protein